VGGADGGVSFENGSVYFLSRQLLLLIPPKFSPKKSGLKHVECSSWSVRDEEAGESLHISVYVRSSFRVV
jgi:hypothetical protein